MLVRFFVTGACQVIVFVAPAVICYQPDVAAIVESGITRNQTWAMDRHSCFRIILCCVAGGIAPGIYHKPMASILARRICANGAAGSGLQPIKNISPRRIAANGTAPKIQKPASVLSIATFPFT